MNISWDDWMQLRRLSYGNPGLENVISDIIVKNELG